MYRLNSHELDDGKEGKEMRDDIRSLPGTTGGWQWASFLLSGLKMDT